MSHAIVLAFSTEFWELLRTEKNGSGSLAAFLIPRLNQWFNQQLLIAAQTVEFSFDSCTKLLESYVVVLQFCLLLNT